MASRDTTYIPSSESDSESETRDSQIHLTSTFGVDVPLTPSLTQSLGEFSFATRSQECIPIEFIIPKFRKRKQRRRLGSFAVTKAL